VKADEGDPKRVVDAYLIHVAGGEEALLKSQEGGPEVATDPGAGPAEPGAEDASRAGLYREGRWGSREVEITHLRLLDSRGRERHLFVPGETVTLVLSVRAEAPVTDFVFGLGLFTADGVNVYGTNTHLEDHEPEKIEGEGEVRIVLEDLRLVEGTYLVDVAAHRRDGTPYDYHRGLLSFRMKSHLKDVGVYRPRHHFEFLGGVSLTVAAPRPEMDLAEAEREPEA
jgi:hypothetical protein